MSFNEDFLREAIRLSFQGMRSGAGGPFGCVVVKDQRIVGRGSNQVTSANDPTAHAEVVAIRDACRALNTFTLTGCQVYASCQPCPMCFGALWWARVGVVYYANTATEAARIGFDDHAIYQALLSPIGNLPEGPGFVHTPREFAGNAFTEWVSRVDKTLY